MALLDVGEIAQLLKVSETSVRRLVRSRRIPHYRLGGEAGPLRFDSDEVLAALREPAAS